MEVREQYRELRYLTDMYLQAQRIRIAAQNRLHAVKQERDEGPGLPFLEDTVRRYSDIEEDIAKRMSKVIKDHPAWPWLSRVKGVGPTLGARLLGLIGDVANFPNVSKLWRFAGLAVIDGKAERPKKGEKLHYNAKLKTTLYLIAISMIRASSPYRRVYDDAKNYYTHARPEWMKNHIHMASLRKMQKVFLAHLWEVWRKAEGLPTRELYVHEKLGHETKYRVEDFIEV